jgi:hypothetical protein
MAEGARVNSQAANGQAAHYEIFTFVLDSNGREYDLIKYEGKLPRRSTRGTLFGDMVDQSTIAVESFVEEQSQIRYHFWERPWNLHQYFDAVTSNRYTFVNSLDGDDVPDFAEVTLTPSSDPCGNGQFQTYSSCSQIRTAVKCALSGTTHDPVNYYNRVYIGPNGWGCGAGLGSVSSGSSQSAFSALSATSAEGLSVPIHELGHNLGLQHSNQENTPGTVQEYGDFSCMMGVSFGGDRYWRKGFNAVQLWRLGLMEEGRTLELASTDTNASGVLYSTYFQEDEGAVTKLIKLGDSNYFLSNRSPVDQTVDQQVDMDRAPGLVPSYTGRILVHYLEPETVGEINKNQVTVVDTIDSGEVKTIGGYTVRGVWANDEMFYFRIGPSPAAAPPRPSDIGSAGTIVARADSTSPYDASTTVSNETCEQPVGSVSAFCTSYDLDGFNGDATDKDVFVRLKVNMPKDSIIHSATLRLQQAANYNGHAEFSGGNGSITLQVQAEDTDSATSMIPGQNIAARSFILARERTFSLPLHWSDEVSFNITEIIQAMVNRPGWVGGSYVLLNLRRTGGTGSNVGFSSARLDATRGFFSSPRIIIDNGCKVVNTGELDASSDKIFEACESLTLGPSFTASNNSDLLVSSGMNIKVLPGFSIEPGSTLSAQVCGQSLCSTSPDPMPIGCHSCVVQVCDDTPSCCTTEFNQACVDKVASICGLQCQ